MRKIQKPITQPIIKFNNNNDNNNNNNNDNLINNNNNNNNNFISIALLSYVQSALQSCKQPLLINVYKFSSISYYINHD